MKRRTVATVAAVVGMAWLTVSATAKPELHLPEQQDPQGSAAEAAARILRKADEATKAVRMVSYHATLEGTGWAKSRTWTLAGDVIASKGTDTEPPVFLYALTSAQAPGSDDVQRYTAGSDGLTFFLIDYQTKKVHEDIAPGVLGRGGRLARSLAMVEFVHATPFTDEITGDKSLLMGSETIDGVECYKVYVLYKDGRQEAEWYFSKKDYLPRRVDRILRNAPGERAEQIQRITKLAVDPEVPEERFRSETPDGFTKTNDFAPDPRFPM